MHVSITSIYLMLNTRYCSGGYSEARSRKGKVVFLLETNSSRMGVKANVPQDSSIDQAALLVAGSASVAYLHWIHLEYFVLLGASIVFALMRHEATSPKIQKEEEKGRIFFRWRLKLQEMQAQDHLLDIGSSYQAEQDVNNPPSTSTSAQSFVVERPQESLLEISTMKNPSTPSTVDDRDDLVDTSPLPETKEKVSTYKIGPLKITRTKRVRTDKKNSGAAKLIEAPLSLGGWIWQTPLKLGWDAGCVIIS
eukprot:scaffold6619_cov146-Skeletonema_menzelii.AAC.12